MRHINVIIVFASVLLPLLASAQERVDVKPFDGNPVMTLSAQAYRRVAQDRLVATLQIEKSAKDVTEVQKFINTKMQAAQAVAKKVDNLKVTTGNYSVYKQYSPEPNMADGKPWTPEQREKNSFWQASQQLMLDGNDRDALLKVVAALQKDGFAVQGLSYYLSREAGDKLKDELAVEALETIKQRAEKMAKALGSKDVQYVSFDVNDGFGGAPQPVMMRAMAKGGAMPEMDMAAPVAEAGESEVTVNINAQVKIMK